MRHIIHPDADVPDKAPSSYHLLQSLGSSLSGHHFNNEVIIKRYFDELHFISEYVMF